jgi:hypothetical protein
MAIKHYRDLVAWQGDLVKLVYTVTKTCPMKSCTD